MLEDVKRENNLDKNKINLYDIVITKLYNQIIW